MELSDPAGKHIGLVVALSALRSEASPACGEYPDLAALGDLAASWGFDLIQLLPVNDTGGMSSPYTAQSAFALHPLYLRVSDLPEAATKPDLLARARNLAGAHAGDERLRYAIYLEAKLALLEECFKEAYGADASRLESVEGYRAWLEANPWVPAYAVYSELKRRAGQAPWWSWERPRGPGLAAELWEDPAWTAGTRFRAWLQFRAEGQFRAAALALKARGVGLLGDIPILIGKDSADVWSEPAIFRTDLSAGSPPDGENPLGQNWGFPAYDWAALAKTDHRFWRTRLEVASRYYSAYRIDHVLGFFRLWTVGERERTGFSGRFAPTPAITREELAARGFDADRIRWLSRPHVPLGSLAEAAAGDVASLGRILGLVFDRIGTEDLFLFKNDIRGELDIEERLDGLPPLLVARAVEAWRDRCLIEYEEGRFAPRPLWWETRAWPSLSEAERSRLGEVFEEKRREGERLWEGEGRRLLGLLASSCDMLPTAEDLGGIPPYVPKVLGELGILGLRVLRWTRRWGEEGQPYLPAKEWPEGTVACGSVHDSSTLRGWWEAEADRERTWRWCEASLGRILGPAPAVLDPRAARTINEALAVTSSRIVVYPIQDLLCMSPSGAVGDPAEERVNVPGTDNAWNWGYRLPLGLEALSEDEGLRDSARLLSAAREGRGATRRP